jgi:hypothetical protein
VAGGSESAGGHSEDGNGHGAPAPACGRRGEPVNPRDLMLERTLVGNLFLPNDRQEGARVGLEYEHPDLMDCGGLRTLGRGLKSIVCGRSGGAGGPRTHRTWVAEEMQRLNGDTAAHVAGNEMGKQPQS